jgi:hypothetical protein
LIGAAIAADKTKKGELNAISALLFGRHHHSDPALVLAVSVIPAVLYL